MMDKMREEFEVYAKGAGLPLAVALNGFYLNNGTFEAWDAWQAAKAAPAWVSCAERLPTAEDADCMGNVWVLWSYEEGSKGRVQIATWQATRFAEVSQWAPTGLVRPEPPAEEA